MAVTRGKAKDGPQITMRVEQNRLVPVSQFDAELLGSWREGAVVNVAPVLAMVRAKEKRYFAMLGKLIKVADTPWSNSDTAHEAIKTAAGFIEPYKKSSGEWGAHPRHIATFTDAELDEFFEIFCGIVQARFGIDPETLRKESPDTGLQDSSGGRAASEPDESLDVDPIPVDVEAPDSGDDPDQQPSFDTSPAEDGHEAGGGVGTPRAPSSAALSQEDLDWLKLVGRMLVSATGEDPGVLARQARSIKESYTPETISDRARKLAVKIHNHCMDCCDDNEPPDKKFVATLAGCTVADLRPGSR